MLAGSATGNDVVNSQASVSVHYSVVPAVGSCRIVVTQGAGFPADVEDICVIFFGDQ